MLNELKIRYFLSLAKHLSFSAAAKELHITQQALSKQISQLEQELECSLFIRTPRGVELTDAGEVMKKTFFSILNSMESAMVEIRNNVRNTGRILNIGCAAGLRPGPFMNSICRKYTKETGIDIWLGQPDTYDDLINWVAEDKFDLALCTDDYGGLFPELASFKLCKTPMYFFVSRSSPMAAANASLRDFRDMGFYLTDNKSRTDRILAVCARERFLPGKILSAANPYSTHLMVELGNSVTFGTGFSVLHTNPAVRAYRLSDESASLICLWHPEQANDLIRSFVKYLQKTCDPEQWFFPSRN